jgi:hypothetical protein
LQQLPGGGAHGFKGVALRQGWKGAQAQKNPHQRFYGRQGSVFKSQNQEI